MAVTNRYPLSAAAVGVLWYAENPPIDGAQPMRPVRIPTESIPTTVIKATRSILVLRILAAVLAGILAIVGWQLSIFALPTLLGVMALVGIAGAARAALGAVYVSPTGIRFRSGMTMTAIRWSEVFRFDEIGRPWSRVLAVEREVRGSLPVRVSLPVPMTSMFFHDPAFDRDVALLRAWAGTHKPQAAAPTRLGFGSRRSARLALVVILLLVALVDRPFGWISGAQATSVPLACAALSEPLSTRIGASDPDTRSAISATTSSCEWTVPSGTLTVSYVLFPRKGLHGGSDRAAEDETIRRLDSTNLDYENIDGVLPGASSKIHAPGSAMATYNSLLMITRSANVEIVVQMTYGRPTDALLAAFGTATNTSIAAVTTGS
jgi:hypothetical protein